MEEDENTIENDEEGEVKASSFKSAFTYPQNWEEITDNNYQKRLSNVKSMTEIFSESSNTDNTTLEQHFYDLNIQQTHKESFGTCYACLICDKKFEEKKFAEKHLRVKHSDKLEEYIEKDKFNEKARKIYSNDPYLYVPIEKERTQRNSMPNKFNNSFNRRRSSGYKDPDEVHPIQPKSSLINYGDI